MQALLQAILQAICDGAPNGLQGLRIYFEPDPISLTSALIGASNFFELAVAAISLFGFESGAALTTVVGVLIEVPVMLSVVYLVKRSHGWYEKA